VIDFIDMESTKNQREVETRLRDALKYDRARVQLGKISRFGLMELSRQRLRPALAESAYIPCPRCHGIGHIRGTESTALHILRIIQEEAMKDNTAQVVAQVPVDVATFLLNEKRTDVLTIEQRFKVNVLLVPNRHLETPNYSVERLRHDDLNQSEPLPLSFDMVKEPEKIDPAQQIKEEATAPRQEAMVKGIAPAQPAPLPVEKPIAHASASASPAGESWFSRVLEWFRAKPEATPPMAEVKSREARPADRNRDGRRDGRRGDDRDRPRGDSRRGGEQRRDEPREARRGGGDPRRDQRGEHRDQRNEGQQNRGASGAQGTARRDERRDGNRGPQRESQKPREQREPRNEAALVTEDAVPMTASTSPPALQNETKEGGRRRRGRRGRGGDRSDRPAQSDAGVRDAANAPSVADVVEMVAGGEPVVATPMREPKPPKTPREPRPPRESREPREPREARAQRTAPPLEGEVEVALSEAPVAEPVAEPTIAPPVRPVEPVHVALRPPMPELPPIALTLPADSDLVLVETSHHAPVPIEETPTPRQKRVRPTRVETASEPLEIVETRKES
jgi:ribonuclease E